MQVKSDDKGKKLAEAERYLMFNRNFDEAMSWIADRSTTALAMSPGKDVGGNVAGA